MAVLPFFLPRCVNEYIGPRLYYIGLPISS